MKKRGVREDAVEATIAEIERAKALMQHLADTVHTRHRDERGAAIEPGRLVPQAAKEREISPRSAPEIEDPQGAAPWTIRWLTERSEERRVVLAHVVEAGAFPERDGLGFVVSEGARFD